MAKRTLTIDITSDIEEDEYVDLANAFWMFLRSTRHNFKITPDSKSDATLLNDAWAAYGEEAEWEE